MMRRLLGLSVVAATLCVASSALAAPGVNLSWNFCSGEGTGASNKTFACASNAGTNTLVCSFELASDLAQVSGNELVLDVLTQQPTLPAWWDFKNTGTCRIGSLGFNVVFDGSNVVCVDWAQGGSTGGIGAYDQSGVTGVGSGGSVDPSLSSSHRRIKIALAVQLSGLQDLVTNTEYFSGNVTINNAKTVGTGACAGCTEPMCIVLNSIKCTTNSPLGANDVFIGNASSPGSNITTWQGTGPNCQQVPTKNVTWGQVKSLYR